jgi:hypothetical protein
MDDFWHVDIHSLIEKPFFWEVPLADAGVTLTVPSTSIATMSAEI